MRTFKEDQTPRTIIGRDKIKDELSSLAHEFRQVDTGLSDLMRERLTLVVNAANEQIPGLTIGDDLNSAKLSFIGALKAEQESSSLETCARALKSLAHSPDLAASWLALGEGLAKLNEHDLAIKMIRRAESLNPSYVRSMYENSSLPQVLGDLSAPKVSQGKDGFVDGIHKKQEAISILEQEIMKFLHIPDTQDFERIERAIAIFSKITVDSEKSDREHNLLLAKALERGFVEMGSDETEIAVVCLVEAIGREPNNARAWQLAAHILSDCGAHPASSILFEQAVKLNPDDASIADDTNEMVKFLSGDSDTKPALTSRNDMSRILEKELKTLRNE